MKAVLKSGEGWIGRGGGREGGGEHDTSPPCSHLHVYMCIVQGVLVIVMHDLERILLQCQTLTLTRGAS